MEAGVVLAAREIESRVRVSSFDAPVQAGSLPANRSARRRAALRIGTRAALMTSEPIPIPLLPRSRYPMRHPCAPRTTFFCKPDNNFAEVGQTWRRRPLVPALMQIFLRRLSVGGPRARPCLCLVDPAVPWTVHNPLDRRS